MKLQSLKIRGLFDLFDYDIQFPEEENGQVLILTGLNGMGKTQILNLIYHLFEGDISLIHRLEFSKIELIFDNWNVVLEKKVGSYEGVPDLKVSYKVEGSSTPEVFRYENSDSSKKHHSSFLSNKQNLQNERSRIEQSWKKAKLVNSSRLLGLRALLNVHLVKEQRLFKEIELPKVENVKLPEGNFVIKAINTYPEQLNTQINKFTRRSLEISQSLDSLYPKRLIHARAEEILSEKDYTEKATRLKALQTRLRKHDLYEQVEEPISYSERDAKALSIYLNDLEEKLGVFKELLEKLELFTEILNERRFTFKKIFINKEEGFYFENSKGKRLNLEDLSSGEQHQLVLMYELIFNTNENMLVLIDEPEISLHISWQKEFLSDLLKIRRMSGFQVILATHAPAIVNGNWDLVYTLEAKQDEEEGKE